MGIEGSLAINLEVASCRVLRVQIGSSRPVHAARIFCGKDIQEVLQTLPVVFSICGTAQACAAVRACEQALGMRPSPQIEDQRACLVRMENLREQLWRILLEWPGFLEEEPDRQSMMLTMALQRDYRAELTGGRNPFLLPGDGHVLESVDVQDLVTQLSGLLEVVVFGMPPQRWLDISDIEEFATWVGSGQTPAARTLGLVMAQDWRELGRCHMEDLPALESEQLHRLLQDDAFVAQPQWLGSCRETTSCTRVESQLLQQLRDRYGNGLLVRMVARLTEIAQLSLNLLPAPGETGPVELAGVQNPGIGQVAAARGQLVHRVELQEGVVSNYQILAPTEWNFHPCGLVATGLATLKGDESQITKQARLLIDAIDPCVGYELIIS
ncbi:MAG: hypothetical protein GY814_09080 [Gammaproteobacteria bacterium]|nr:hypothetical protein [Gammaproteobacteria bacterium]